MARLVTRIELSKRMANKKKSTLYNDCKEGGILGAAMTSGLIDLDHPSAKSYCEAYGYVEPAAIPTPPKKTDTDAISLHDSDEKTATDIMGMTLREAVRRYGKGIEFKEYTMAYHKLVQTQGMEEDQARKRGEFIHRVHAERVIAMVDSLHKALMSDAVTNIASSAASLAKAGADRSTIEAAAREPIERTIKTVKNQIVRALREI